LNIPVVAYNAGAVKETMNNGGILVNQKDFIRVAALIDHVLTDSRLKEQILCSQQKALKKYLKNKTGKILLDHLQRL
jgi:glycosyltransferase involved in cell wall biosynthesis